MGLRVGPIPIIPLSGIGGGPFGIGPFNTTPLGLFLGGLDIKYPPPNWLIKTLLELSRFLGYCLMIPTLASNSLVSYAKIFPVMFFLIESITLLKISLILILFCLNLNISKCSLTLYYTIKLSFVKELFMTKFYLMVWLSMNSPKINLIKDTFIPL